MADGIPDASLPDAHRQRRAIGKRLARAEGHRRALRAMVETERDCADLLVQLAAVRGAIDRVVRLRLEDHMKYCPPGVDQARDGQAAWRESGQALGRYWGGTAR